MRRIAGVLFAVVAGLLPGFAAADIVPPTDQVTGLTFSYDRGSLPGNAIIWNKLTGGYDIDNPIYGRNMVWLCTSASDPAKGACGTSIWSDPNPTTIRIQFTERRSKASTVISAIGKRHIRYVKNNRCGVVYGAITGLVSPRSDSCRWYTYIEPADSAEIDVYFSPEELAKIPVGGVWEGTLVLDQYRYYVSGSGPGGIWNTKVATLTANITLDVTDKNRGDIYLPAFGSAAPLVDLNLRTRPLSTAPGGEVSGKTTIDTCLYDGYNSNSPWLKVTLSDLLNIPGRGSDIFSVVKNGAPDNNSTNRIDYRIALNYNGTSVAVNNNQQLMLPAVDQGLIRPVSLAGFPVAVVCTPTPLTLDVVPFSKASKTAGRYQGTLRISLAATALAP